MEQEIQDHANQKLPLQGVRGAILAAVLQNQPDLVGLPDITFFKGDTEGAQERYITTLTTIGGKVFKVKNFDEIKALIPQHFDADKRMVSTLPELSDIAELNQGEPIDPHTLEDIELSVIRAHFGVSENGSVWVTEDLMGQRVLPFICQHLAVVIDAENIVPTMHEAYQRIGSTSTGFGTFIAGPSKTADIEQSLVLGAHGPRSMTVFLLG
jgi:L-lactate dehydrogenase complex protein LldG